MNYHGKAALAATLLISTTANAGFVLSLGGGQGNAIIEVDGFGSFGNVLGPGGNNDDRPGPATFEPQGGNRADAVAVSVGAYSANGAARSIRTSGSVFGNSFDNPIAITDDNGTAVSNFTVADGNGTDIFSVELRQSVAELLDSNGMRSGTELFQEYAFTNLTGADATLDIARYLDGNLGFDNSSDDGGGFLFIDGQDYVFVTDEDDAQAGSTATTFVGLTSESPSAELDDGYEVGGAPFELLSRIQSDQQLLDVVIDDINPVDFFVDIDSTRDDIAIAISSLFRVSPNATLAYTDRTVFGFGAPEDLRNAPTPDPDPVPAPASLLLIGSGLLLGLRKRRPTAKQS